MNRCGTRKGWNDHMRAHEPSCRDCNDANTAYTRDLRGRRGTRYISYPTETPDLDVAWLGVIIARAIRESA